MKVKSFFYEAADGVHYPDSQRGASYIYGVDFNNFLDTNQGNLLGVSWILEEGLTENEIFFYPGEPKIACINVGTPYAGSFTLKCVMSYESFQMQQTLAVPLIIKVY